MFNKIFFSVKSCMSTLFLNIRSLVIRFMPTTGRQLLCSTCGLMVMKSMWTSWCCGWSRGSVVARSRNLNFHLVFFYCNILLLLTAACPIDVNPARTYITVMVYIRMVASCWWSIWIGRNVWSAQQVVDRVNTVLASETVAAADAVLTHH